MSEQFDRYLNATEELRTATAVLLSLRDRVCRLAIDLPWTSLVCEGTQVSRHEADGRANIPVIDLQEWPDASNIVSAVQSYQTKRREAGVQFSKLSPAEKTLVKAPHELGAAN